MKSSKIPVISEFEIVNMIDIKDRFKVPNESKDSKRSRILRRKYRNAVLYSLAASNGNDEPECVKCEFDDIRALHIDHKYGGGGIHAKEFKNNRPKYYKSMLSHLEDFQILCANCNAIKVIENRKKEKKG